MSQLFLTGTTTPESSPSLSHILNIPNDTIFNSNKNVRTNFNSEKDAKEEENRE
jgi:hypothetical protein